MEFNAFAQLECPGLCIVCFEALCQFRYQLAVTVDLGQVIGEHVSGVLRKAVLISAGVERIGGGSVTQTYSELATRLGRVGQHIG